MIVREIQRRLPRGRALTSASAPTQSQSSIKLRVGRRFDVILCDLMMPTMSGIDVYNAIRDKDADQARRIVFMTGGAFTERALEFSPLMRTCSESRSFLGVRLPAGSDPRPAIVMT